MDSTEKVLATMCKQKYLICLKDNTGGETSSEYHLGPRAKAEIGKEGVVSFVKEVYGVQAPEDVEERVGRNIGIEEVVSAAAVVGGRKGRAAGGTQGRKGEDGGEEEEEEGEVEGEDSE